MTFQALETTSLKATPLEKYVPMLNAMIGRTDLLVPAPTAVPGYNMVAQSTAHSDLP